MLLAVASISDVEVARGVLGTTADGVMDDAVARGLLAVTDRKSLSLHPLLRELLIRRFEDADDETREAHALARPETVRAAPVGRGAVRRRGGEECGLRHRGNRSSTGRPTGSRPDEQPPALGRRRAFRGSRRRPHRLRRERGATTRERSRPGHGPCDTGSEFTRGRSGRARLPRRGHGCPSDGPPRSHGAACRACRRLGREG